MISFETLQSEGSQVSLITHPGLKAQMYVVCDKNKLVCKHTLRACEACTGPERGSAIVAGICPICPFAMPTDEGASDTTGMRQLAEGYQACAGRLMMHACWTLIERVELITRCFCKGTYFHCL